MIDSIITYFLICWQKAFDYKGRARRLEFNSFVLITIIFATAIQFIEMLIKEYVYPYPDLLNFALTTSNIKNGQLITTPFIYLPTLTCIFLLASLAPLLSVMARRFQDLNKSKYWIFYLFLPIFYVLIEVILFYLGFTTGSYLYYTFLVLLLYGFVLILKLLFQEGEAEENKYGKSPKLEEN